MFTLDQEQASKERKLTGAQDKAPLPKEPIREVTLVLSVQGGVQRTQWYPTEKAIRMESREKVCLPTDKW